MSGSATQQQASALGVMRCDSMLWQCCLLQEVRAIMAQYMPLQEQDADVRSTPNGI